MKKFEFSFSIAVVLCTAQITIHRHCICFSFNSLLFSFQFTSFVEYYTTPLPCNISFLHFSCHCSPCSQMPSIIQHTIAKSNWTWHDDQLTYKLIQLVKKALNLCIIIIAIIIGVGSTIIACICLSSNHTSSKFQSNPINCNSTSK